MGDLAPTSLASVGEIYQRFSRPGPDGCGRVENLIYGGLPPFLEDYSGARLTVFASYTVEGSRRIALSFEEAQVSELKLSELGKTLAAPAILPRGMANMRLLQFIQVSHLPIASQGVRPIHIDAALPDCSPRLTNHARLLRSIVLLSQNFSLKAPLTNPLSGALPSSVGRPSLLLSYLDDTILVGQAIPGGGVYILERVDEEDGEGDGAGDAQA